MIKTKIIPFIQKSSDYTNYADKGYWLKRYERIESSYEWYDDYETIKPIIKELNIPKRSIILNIGIGNSEFSEKMYDEGYKKNYNIDFARNVIHYMKQRNKRIRSSMIFETMDILDIEYEDEQFHAIFDKATLDCVFCGIDVERKINKFMNEIYRVLKPKGYFIMISNSEPEKRIKYLQNDKLKFNIMVHKIENEEEDIARINKLDIDLNFLKKDHYVYVCKKMEEEKNLNEEILENDDEEENSEIKKDNNEELKEEEEKINNNKLEKESSISYIRLEEFQKIEKSNKSNNNSKK